MHEDQAGQRILHSQSMDGNTLTSPGSEDWDQTLLPNISTSGQHAALFAEPMLNINGRHYAAASPSQFCLYPNQVGVTVNAYLLLRRVHKGVGKLWGVVLGS